MEERKKQLDELARSLGVFDIKADDMVLDRARIRKQEFDQEIGDL